MIYDLALRRLPLVLRADACVIGTGAGGAPVAALLAEAGLSVVVLEAGGILTPGDVDQREDTTFPRIFAEGGARTTEDRAIRILQGEGVGGSTFHNTNLIKRIPDEILAEWSRDAKLERLPPAAFAALYEEAEALLSVTAIPPEQWNAHNRLLEAGCRALGWRGGGLRHNRTGCVGSGFCELGCAFDAKNNALKVFVPRAVRAGAEIFTNARATAIVHAAGRALGVEGVALAAHDREVLGRFEVRAPIVVCAASATETPALLLRSKVRDPSKSTGRSLRIHPSLVVAAEMPEIVDADRGVPQSYECTEFLRFDEDARRPERPSRIWIVPAFGHPGAVAAMIPGVGAEHRRAMARFRHLAAFGVLLHDHTRGTVAPAGETGIRIRYKPEADDRRELALGAERAAELLFAAGAERVVVPLRRPIAIERGARLGLETIAEGELLSAVHPMGSVPMSDDPARAAVGSDGAHHHLDGLYVSDGSLFPTSIGGPPQLSIYALALHVARGILARR